MIGKYINRNPGRFFGTPDICAIAYIIDIYWEFMNAYCLPILDGIWYYWF